MKQGRVMLTFDDGIANHWQAALDLTERKLRGVFGVVTNRLGEPGFLDRSHLTAMRQLGHLIVGHSANHLKLGQVPPDAVTADVTAGRDKLTEMGFLGRYLTMPFGTSNVHGPDHLAALWREFDWIRLSFGVALGNNWLGSDVHPLWPSGYRGKVIGVTAAADVRWPGRVESRVEEACVTGSLCVLMYHDICHVVGEMMNITRREFLHEVDYIAHCVRDGRLECVTPVDLMEGTA